MQRRKLIQLILASLFISFSLFALEPYNQNGQGFTKVEESDTITGPYSSTNEEIVSVKMVSEEASVTEKKPFWVAFEFQIQGDWHLYWKNPGDAGQGPIIRWMLPEGFSASDPLWPAPERLEIDQAVVYGYSGKVTLLTKITPPAHFSAASVDLKADVDWFACSTVCVPGSASFVMKLPVGGKAPNVTRSVTSIFKQARGSLPHDAKFTKADIRDHTLEIHVHQDLPFANVKNVDFFLEQQDVLNPHDRPSWDLSKDKKTLIVKIKSDMLLDATTLYPLSGVLVVEEESVLGPLKSSWSVRLARPKHAEPASNFEQKYEAAKQAKAQNVDEHLAQLENGVWYRKLLNEISIFLKSEFTKILIWAFVGGILLNIMPCVLPVISIKLMHFVQLQGISRGLLARHGLIYSLGVLISFWVLSGAIYVLQSFGHVVGWGFQLQEPVFVAIMIIILFLLSLSLFGLFEFGISVSGTTGSWEQSVAKRSDTPSFFASFASGVLATFVAAPCTGPLLGSAIGFAATLQPAYSFAIFTALGLGMAFPFLLICLFPALSKFLPKPGRWMVTFKQLMGFFLLATILWLVWVLDAETENLSAMYLLLSLFIISFGAWIYGNWGSLDRQKRTRIIAKVISLILVVFGSWLFISHIHKIRSVEKDLQVGDGWESFSLKRLESLIAQGKPVFVDVTAKWCLTCQTNGLVLESDKVKKAFATYGIIKLKADWTTNDETITRYIRSLGRNGVPLYVIYNGERKPEVLPEVITPDIVIDALKKTKE